MVAQSAGEAMSVEHRVDERAGADSVPPVVRLLGVSKRFGGVLATDDVTLEIPHGHFTTLLGPSGCGKTTLLRILAGFDEPTSGHVEIGGRDMRGVPPERRPVNMVFQRYALFPHRDVLRNVLFGLESAGVSREEAVARAREALATCNIEGLESRRISELSGGQAQRVAVARAIVNKPQMLLLDEPLAALDLKLRRHMQFELRRLQQELRTTFLYVTHDQGEALSMSDSIVLMNGGRVVQHSPPRELYDSPRSVFAATFIGEANVLPCTVQRVSSAGLGIEVEGLPMEASAGVEGVAEGPAHLYVRPECVRLALPGRGLSGFAVTVANAAFEGGFFRYWLTITGTPRQMVAEVPVRPGEAVYQVGDRLIAGWEPGDGHVLTE